MRAISDPLARRSCPRNVTVNIAQRKLQDLDYGGLNSAIDPQQDGKVSDKRGLRSPLKSSADTPVCNISKDATKSIHQLIRERRYKEAMEVFHLAEKRDAILFDSALNACAKGLLYDKAEKVWNDMPQEWRSVVSYTTMIDLCKRLKKIQHAERLFNEMRAAGVEPNAITFNSMISAYSAAGQPQKALGTFEALRSSLLPGASVLTKQMSYLAVMSAVARAGDYAKTRELFVAMAADGTPPNAMHVNALLTSCAKAPDATTAQAIFEMLPSWSLEPRLEEYAILLSCHRYDLPRCQQIISDMRQAGVEPTWICFKQLLQAHVLAKDGEGARTLLSQADCLDRDSSSVRKLIAEVDALMVQSPSHQE